MATKPTASVKWASEGTALKLAVASSQELFGWTTSTGTISGTPQKPLLQYENGWRWAVYQWIEYLALKTDETTPDQTNKNGLFLKSVSGTPTWESVYPDITTANVTAKHSLIATASSTEAKTTDVTWGYPWPDPAALASANEFTFLRWNGTAYSFQSPFPAFTGNGNKVLKLNAGATAFSWQTIYEVGTPSQVGYILTSTGALPGGYVWAPPTFAGSAITSGTVDAARLPTYIGASAGTAGTQGVVPAALAGDQAKFLSGAGTWVALKELPAGGTTGQFLTTNGTTASWTSISQVPSQTSQAGKYLTTDGTTASWVQTYQVPGPLSAGLLLQSTGGTPGSYQWVSPSFAGSAITSGTVAAAYLPTMVGANGTVAGTQGLVPQPAAAANVQFLRGDGTWQAISQVPAAGAANTVLTSNGTISSWQALTAAQIPSLDASKIGSGFLAQARITAFSGATSGSAGSLGGVPIAAAGDQGKFLRADATWQAAPVFGKLESGATGAAIDFSLYNVVNATSLTGSTTFTFSNLSPGRIITIAIKSSAPFTITWPNGMKWADGLPLTSATTAAALVTIVSMGTTAADCYATAVRAFT